LAWLLAQGDDIAPIPGTKRVSRVQENTAADAIALSVEQIARLNELAPATGDRHDEANMSTVNRRPHTSVTGSSPVSPTERPVFAGIFRRCV
jgi:hypothetical protein